MGTGTNFLLGKFGECSPKFPQSRGGDGENIVGESWGPIRDGDKLVAGEFSGIFGENQVGDGEGIFGDMTTSSSMPPYHLIPIRIEYYFNSFQSHHLTFNRKLGMVVNFLNNLSLFHFVFKGKKNRVQACNILVNGSLLIFRELHSTFISHEVTLENYSLVTQVLGACGNP